MPATRSSTDWEFDRFTLLPAQRILLCDGTPVPLTAKAFDTLVLLVDNRDRVVTKDEALRAIWPDVAVEEGNLTQQIFLLRKALGESAQQPRFIATIPGHGYRFVGPVSEIASSGDREDSLLAASAPTLPPVKSRRARLVLAVIGLCAVVGLAGIVVRPWRHASGVPEYLEPSKLRVARVTESGKAGSAAISPDGRFVAYTEDEGDEQGIWVKDLTTGGMAQVAPRRARVRVQHLAFSPDGQFLYFARGEMVRGGSPLYRMPFLGGPETPLVDDVDTPVSFSPDGSRFAFMRGAENADFHIVVADTTGRRQVLAARQPPLAFAYAGPAWSPDGRTIAAVGADYRPDGKWSIVLLSVEDGSSREIFTSEDQIGRLRWVPDGSGVLAVVAAPAGRRPPRTGDSNAAGGAIWFIASTGAANRLTFDLADYDLCCIDIASDGHTIVNVLNSLVSNVWIAPAHDLDKPKQITWGRPVLRRHSWLPDNDTIVYRDSSGALNTVTKEGRTSRLALADDHKLGGGVSACGNGRYVVFEATPGSSIWRLDPAGGGPFRLTDGPLDYYPACSADGRWATYTSMHTVPPSLWRIPIEGGEPTRLVESAVVESLPSPSGRFLYYTGDDRDEQPNPRRRARWNVISLADGTRLFGRDRPEDATMRVPQVWAPDDSGIDYVVTRAGVSNIWRMPLAGGPPLQITHFATGRIFSFAWSPDGRWLSLASGSARKDAVLLSSDR